MLKVKDWLKTEQNIDYSIRKCSNCNLYNTNKKNSKTKTCELDLQHKCVTFTGNPNHGDYWIDNNE